jgi:hypothetical protein
MRKAVDRLMHVLVEFYHAKIECPTCKGCVICKYEDSNEHKACTC